MRFMCGAIDMLFAISAVMYRDHFLSLLLMSRDRELPPCHVTACKQPGDIQCIWPP